MPEFNIFPLGDGGLPPQVEEIIKQQMEHRSMHMQTDVHTIKQFLDGLTSDQLSALDLLLSACGSVQDVVYYRGRIDSIQEVKFGICPCGHSHDPEQFLTPEVNETSTENPWDEVGSLEWHQKLKEYDLTVVYSSHAESDWKLTCVCGMEYVSLADRMLRPKGIDGCSGCQHRSAHG